MPHRAAAGLRAVSWRCYSVMPGGFAAEKQPSVVWGRGEYVVIRGDSGFAARPVGAKPSKGFSPTPLLPTCTSACSSHSTRTRSSSFVLMASYPTGLRRLCERSPDAALRGIHCQSVLMPIHGHFSFADLALPFSSFSLSRRDCLAGNLRSLFRGQFLHPGWPA